MPTGACLHPFCLLPPFAPIPALCTCLWSLCLLNCNGLACILQSMCFCEAIERRGNNAVHWFTSFIPICALYIFHTHLHLLMPTCAFSHPSCLLVPTCTLCAHLQLLGLVCTLCNRCNFCETIETKGSNSLYFNLNYPLVSTSWVIFNGLACNLQNRHYFCGTIKTRGNKLHIINILINS